MRHNYLYRLLRGRPADLPLRRPTKSASSIKSEIQYRVKQIIRPRYGCRACENAVVQASAPAQPIDGGMATEAFLAHIAMMKYGFHMPLYRLEQMFAAQGIDLNRQTLALWMADLIADNLAACGIPRSIYVLDPMKPTTCSGFPVSLAHGAVAASPQDIRGETGTLGPPSISVHGISPMHNSPPPHPQLAALAGTPALRSELVRMLVGVLAHELAHCKTRVSQDYKSRTWNQAMSLSALGKGVRAAADRHPDDAELPGLFNQAYAEYVLNDYEAHGHATQAVAAVVHDADASGGPGAVKALKASPAAFEAAFRATWLAQYAAGRGGPHGPALVDALWALAPGILAKMA